MNLDELQSVQARERQSSDLQHLRPSFYREVGEFISGLNEERARIVEAAEDPFSEPEVRRITDDIETAESTVEAIYERRVGKVVKKASIAAAGMPVEDDGLTTEESALFEDLVSRIESNRETVLSALDGEAPTVSCSIDESTEAPDGAVSADGSPSSDPASDAPTAGGRVDAADLMGSGEGTTDVGADDATPQSPPTLSSGSGPEPERASDSTGSEESSSVPEASSSGAESESPPTVRTDAAPSEPTETPPLQSDQSPTGADGSGVARTTVRVTADIGEIVGADDRDYDLTADDVVTLPNPNADVLVEKNAAERLE